MLVCTQRNVPIIVAEDGKLKVRLYSWYYYFRSRLVLSNSMEIRLATRHQPLHINDSKTHVLSDVFRD